MRVDWLIKAVGASNLELIEKVEVVELLRAIRSCCLTFDQALLLLKGIAES